MSTHGNEQVGDLTLIFEPSLAVLGATPLDVTQSTVRDHAGEEQRVEPGEGAGESSDEAPVQGEEEIASVVDLAGLAIYTEEISTAGEKRSPPEYTYTTHPQGSWSHRRQ